MIISLLFGFIDFILQLIFTILPPLPGLPDEVMVSINSFVSLVVHNGLSIFFFLVRPSTVSLAIPIIIAITFADEIYKFIIWILKKIPFINIS